jgi:hypothetical protein
VEARSHVELPPEVGDAFDVFVNGVLQHPGVDFDRVGRSLVFRRQLAAEGKLGFWRWAGLFFGVAGSYGQNDTVDVVYLEAGRRTVLSLRPTLPA